MDKTKALYELLVGTAINLLEVEIPVTLKERLRLVAEEAVDDFYERKVSSKNLVKEAITQELVLLETGMSNPNNLNPLGNKGILTDRGNMSHVFKKQNICPYFLDKFELCALDGRICPYDSETYMICKRYKEGIDKQIPGKNGKVPVVAPTMELPDDAKDIDLEVNK